MEMALNLFRGSSSLDKDVENSLCRIAKFHSNINYSTFRQGFTESRQDCREEPPRFVAPAGIDQDVLYRHNLSPLSRSSFHGFVQ